MFRVARKIRVGRETGNTHIFFLGLITNFNNSRVYLCNKLIVYYPVFWEIKKSIYYYYFQYYFNTKSLPTHGD